MKFDYVCDRMAEVMEGDWRGKAEVILEERKRTGNGTVSCLCVPWTRIPRSRTWPSSVWKLTSRFLFCSFWVLGFLRAITGYKEVRRCRFWVLVGALLLFLGVSFI